VRAFLVLLGAVLLVLAFAPATAPEGLPAPRSHGPFPVAFYNTTVPQAGPGGADAPATVFHPSTVGGEFGAPDTTLAPYGTVAFAPGYGASRIDYWEMLVNLAADGFVAIGVDYDPSPFPNTDDMADRVGYTLDYLESENASAPSALYGMVDSGRLVSAGHSMGGGVSVLAGERHARFDAVLPLSPFITAPLFWAPNLPADAVRNVAVPMQIIVGSADTTAAPGVHANVLYANGNCPKSNFLITGADHTFSNPAHRQLVAQYASRWLHYYLERDATVFDALFGGGAEADQAAGLITYSYCLDVASVVVAPSPAVVLLGGTQPFTAAVYDRIGTPWNASIAWSTAGGIGVIDAAGLFLAQNGGVGSVTADSGGLQDTALVTTGLALRPTIVWAVLSGGGLGDLQLEWGRSADEGAAGGPVLYRVLQATGDPIGPYAELVQIAATGAATYTHTCLGCGHIPGDTTPLFFKVEAVDPTNATRGSNLAARYAKAVVMGANLLGLPLTQYDPDPGTVLQTVGGSVSVVRAYTAADGADPWKAEYTSRSGDLQTLSAGGALWIETAVPGQYTIAGLVPDIPAVGLEAGWTLTTYVALAGEDFATSVAGLPVTHAETFAPAPDPYRLRRVLAMETLTWGEPYWVHSTATVTWLQG